MKITLAMVMSLDGKTTQWGDPQLHAWTSKEDQKHFSSLLQQQRVIIMGRRTYDVASSYMQHIPSRLRIVMTKTPEKYSSFAKPGMLEFTDETPKELCDRLQDNGIEMVLLVGGEQVNTLFFKAKLVNEILLTIEPYIFGKGNMLVSLEQLSVSLRLEHLEQMNKEGTLLLTYTVL